MSQRELLEAAGVGHRITHEDDLPPPRTLAVTAIARLGATPRGSGAMTAVNVGRTLTVQSLGELEGEDPGEAPDPSGAIEEGSPNTFMGQEMRPIATADEEIDVPCEDHSDGPILTGALTVFVNGKPIVRRTDELDCGAFVGEGEPTVLIGGPTTEWIERRPEGSYGRTRGIGSIVAQEMYRMHPPVGPKLGRTLAGAPLREMAPPRVASEAPRAVTVAQQLAARNNAGLLRALTTR